MLDPGQRSSGKDHRVKDPIDTYVSHAGLAGHAAIFDLVNVAGLLHAFAYAVAPTRRVPVEQVI